MHFLCTICTEIITQDELESMYFTKCGHIFHYQCLTRWIQRSPCCPQCRKKVTKRLMCRVYPTLSDEPSYDSKLTEALLNTQQQLNAQIQEKDATLVMLRKDLENSNKTINQFKHEVASLKLEVKGQLGEIEQQKNLRAKLQKDFDRSHYHSMGKDIKYDKKLTALRDRYRYQVKRNIEWRKAAKKKQVEIYKDFIKKGCGKHRKCSTRSSDSLSTTDSPKEVQSATKVAEQNKPTEMVHHLKNIMSLITSRHICH